MTNKLASASQLQDLTPPEVQCDRCKAWVGQDTVKCRGGVTFCTPCQDGFLEWVAGQIDQGVDPSAGKADGRAESDGRWYLGTMNDSLFIIDQPPQPGPVDYVCSLDHGVNVIAAMGNDRVRAEAIIAAHKRRLRGFPAD